jgi:hypothetical protein
MVFSNMGFWKSFEQFIFIYQQEGGRTDVFQISILPKALSR